MVSVTDLPKKCPQVVIDARMVTKIPHGISRYVTQLAKGLRRQQEGRRLEYNPVFLLSSLAHAVHFAPFNIHVVKAPFLHPGELLEIPQVLKTLDARLYHSPSFSSLWYCPCPSVITIHDLNHLTYGEWSKKIYYEILLKRFARRSTVIATVSEFSRNEIAQWLKIPPGKIAIVPNAVEPYPAPPASDAAPLKPSLPTLQAMGLEPGKYFFCLSNTKPHKNLPLLVQAYEKFRANFPDAWPLVLSVSDYSTTPGIKSVGAVSDELAHTLLAHSGGMFFPSLYEGFGLPPLEAALLGVPLAISKIPPHEEGLADLLPSEVLWIPPDDLAGWSKAFEKIRVGGVPRTSSTSRDQLLRHFSVDQLAGKMDAIYRQILAE
jgi:glycosyltransferase involved in cell wall biosynthesis